MAPGQVAGGLLKGMSQVVVGKSVKNYLWRVAGVWNCTGGEAVGALSAEVSLNFIISDSSDTCLDNRTR